ncbi:MAG TPA: T9SS type A sorting domain-containing protein [Saprospiraceae bacterium]|nr:T9SS type A sorting domain-containing protein [Saprospiraceae bacterium]
MKNLLLIPLFHLVILIDGYSQVTCIQCFDQNDAISPGASNHIQNGGFETSNCIPGWLNSSYCPNSNFYDCDIANWVCSGGGEFSYPSIFDSTLCLIPEGLHAAYFGNGNCFVCVDLMFDTTCLVRESCTVSGFPSGFPTTLDGYGGPAGVSLGQVVNGLTIGESYVLEFWAGGEPLNGLLLEQGIFAVDVGFGKTYLTCKPTDNTSSSKGTVYLIHFDATAASTTIKFTNWGHMCGDCTELVIDNVSLYTLAELANGVEDCNTAIGIIPENNFLTVYPNPSTDMIWIDGIETQDFSVRILSATGKPIQTLSVQNQLDVSYLIPGVYFLIFEKENETIWRRMVKL